MRTSRLLTILLCVAPAFAGAQTMSASVRYRTVPGFRNIYYTSLPYAHPFQDVADGSLRGNHCVDDVSLGDGAIDVDDVICTVWGNGVPSQRIGSFAIAQFDEATCTFHSRFASDTAFGTLFGGEAWPLDPLRGVQITLATGRGRPQDFTVTYVDDCSPTFPGTVVQHLACTPSIQLLHVPYNSTYRTADEVLCGTQGVDWVDADGNGNPDTCPNGLFDGSHWGIAVETFDNEPDGSGTDNSYVARIITETFSGPLGWSGPNFALRPGESYVVAVVPWAGPRTWNPPLGPCP